MDGWMWGGLVGSSLLPDPATFLFSAYTTVPLPRPLELEHKLLLYGWLLRSRDEEMLGREPQD
jgi:hypothetical protein